MLVPLLSILLLAALLLGLVAFYVAGEFSTISARKTRIRQLAEDGNRSAQRLLPVLENPQRLDNYIAASQVGITLCSIVLGIYGQEQITALLEPAFERLPLDRIPFAPEGIAGGVAGALVLVLLTGFQVVLGELVPKSIAIQYPERVALAASLPMHISANYLLKPLIVVLNGSGALVLRLLGMNHRAEHTHVHSPEEIEILMTESAHGGLLDAEERQLLHNAFRLGELTASEVMVPRTSLSAVPVEMAPDAVLRLAVETAYTRLPVYEGNLDHILGFVHLKDLFRLHQRGEQAPLRTILREAPFVPETMAAVEVWETLTQKQSYIAIVFDEYGGTAGMITQEDLIEELFGELQDEFDQETAPILPVGTGQFIVRGDLTVNALNDLLRTRFDTEVATTVAGLVLDALGRLPQVGDIVEIERVRFRVEAVAGRTVREASLTLPPEIDIGNAERRT